MNDKNYQLIAFTEDGLSLDVRVDAENETLWLTQAEMAELFGVDRTRITRHINGIINDNEVDSRSNVRKTHFANADRPVVLYHLRTIYRNEELSEETTCAESAQVQKEGARTVARQVPLYNLETIVSVGYRVNSKRGIAFRRWANTVLKQYLVEGYGLNEKRLSALNRTVEAQRALLAYEFGTLL